MARTRRTTRMVVDWLDTDSTVLPHDHASSFEIFDYSWKYGAREDSPHRLIATEGSVRVYDPDDELNPLNFSDSSAERARLLSPHRFWIYSLKGKVDGPRQAGWTIIGPRPSLLYAAYRLLSVEFARFEDLIGGFSFNSTAPPPAPPEVFYPSLIDPDPDPDPGPTSRGVLTGISFVSTSTCLLYTSPSPRDS